MNYDGLFSRRYGMLNLCVHKLLTDFNFNLKIPIPFEGYFVKINTYF